MSRRDASPSSPTKGGISGVIAAIKSNKEAGEDDDPFESHRAVTRSMVQFLEPLPGLPVEECVAAYTYTCQIFLRVGVPILVHNMQALGMQRAAIIKARARWKAAGNKTGAAAVNLNNVAAVAAAAAKGTKEVLDDETKAALRKWSRIQVIGTVIFIVGSIINFVAFAFAAASVLAPLEAEPA